MTPGSLAGGCQHCQETYCFHILHVQYITISTLKEEAVCSYEVFILTNQTTQCHISEHRNSLIFSSKKTPNPMFSTMKEAASLRNIVGSL
jgi:hypothetical protein